VATASPKNRRSVAVRQVASHRSACKSQPIAHLSRQFRDRVSLFQDLCEQAQAAGWERRETAYALMVLAASALKQAWTNVETLSEVAEVVPDESGGPSSGSEEGD
jgi:hypothetical protein